MLEAYSHRDINSPMWVLKYFVEMNDDNLIDDEEVAVHGKFVNVLTLKCQLDFDQMLIKTVVELVAIKIYFLLDIAS